MVSLKQVIQPVILVVLIGAFVLAIVSAVNPANAASTTKSHMTTQEAPTDMTSDDQKLIDSIDSEHSLTEMDDGKTVTLSRDEYMAVKLVENPTTGFRWQIDSPSPLPPTLRLVKSLYLRPSATTADGRRLVGVPGHHIYVFQATIPPPTAAVHLDPVTVTLGYRRPWLPPTDPPAQTFTFNVRFG